MTTFSKRATQILLLLAAATALLPASAQAAAWGKIEGRVVRAPSDKPVAGVHVTLRGAERNGSKPMTRTVVTGRNGTYSFAHVPASATRIYALDARYDGGLFAGGAIQVPGDTNKRPVITTQLRVWKTTTDPSAVLITRDDLFVQQNQDGTGVIESIEVQQHQCCIYR